MSGREILALLGIVLALLAGYGRHAVTTAHSLLRLALFRTRAFRVDVSGSFVTRLGATVLMGTLISLFSTSGPDQSGTLSRSVRRWRGRASPSPRGRRAQPALAAGAVRP